MFDLYDIDDDVFPPVYAGIDCGRGGGVRCRSFSSRVRGDRPRINPDLETVIEFPGERGDRPSSFMVFTSLLALHLRSRG